ncbi:hypothetical protein [Halovenus salina]|uniref:Uncharacterized protein n=1 Tax=Halovenus salina TaxID=1510225 RepID=A0ABD5W1D9_9EURY
MDQDDARNVVAVFGDCYCGVHETVLGLDLRFPSSERRRVHVVWRLVRVVDLHPHEGIAVVTVGDDPKDVIPALEAKRQVDGVEPALDGFLALDDTLEPAANGGVPQPEVFKLSSRELSLYVRAEPVEGLCERP